MATSMHRTVSSTCVLVCLHCFFSRVVFITPAMHNRHCLSVSTCNFAPKLRTGLHESFREGNGPVNKQVYFGGDSDHQLNTGIALRTAHYWEIWKVVNGHKSAAHIELPDGGTVPVLLVEFVCQICDTVRRR